MAFPTKPLNPNTSATLSIPQFCLTGSKVDPELTQDVIDTGIQSAPGQSYGQLYPYQWVNWTQYQVGQYLYWLCGPISSNSGAIAYLQAGNFDSGINILNDSTLKFYDSSNTNYVGFSAPTLTAISNYTWPSDLPSTTGTLLTTDSSGIMSWYRKTEIYAFKQLTPVVISAATAFSNCFTTFYFNNALNPSPFNPVTCTFTAPITATYKIDLQFFGVNQVSGTNVAGFSWIELRVNSNFSTYILNTSSIVPFTGVSPTSIFSSDIIFLNANDTVTFFNSSVSTSSTSVNLLVSQNSILTFSWNL